MAENKKLNFSDWSEGVLGISVGIALALWAWAKRPIEFRDSYPEVQEYVLKSGYFYGAILLAVILAVDGIRRLNK